MIDLTTLRLFPDFPRELGNPRRKLYSSADKLEEFIYENDGKTDVFIAIYNTKNFVDKIFFDIDSQNLKAALKVAQIFFTYLKSEDYTIIPICTASKGFHLYIIIEPFRYDLTEVEMKKQLRLVQLELIYECFGEIPVEFDRHVMGNLRQLARIPNTLRHPDNVKRCVYLPYINFDKLTIKQVIKLTRKKQSYDYPINKMPKLFDFEIQEEVKKIRLSHEIDLIEGQSGFERVRSDFLKNIIRPCLYRHLTLSPEPLHITRVAATIDLLRFFNTDEIIEMYRQLNWVDWDEDITRDQINSCKGLDPYFCPTLISNNIPKWCCIE